MWPRHMQGYLGTSVENCFSKLFYENPYTVWYLDFFSQCYKRNPGTCILECQGHLGDYLGVQAEPVDAEVEHGEGADGGHRDGDRLLPDVRHGHHVHQVSNTGYQSIIITVVIIDIIVVVIMINNKSMMMTW